MLFVHIGTHKTGTSALQSALTVGTDDLLENGVRYIRAGREGAIAHHKLARAVRQKKDASLSVWDAVRAEIRASDSPTNVLSSEGLSFANAEAVKRELGEIGDVRIVLYLRRQDKYLQSLYKQTIAGGRTMDFPTWLDRQRARGDYLSLVRGWADQFGEKAIVLRPYERDGATIDVVQDFIGILGHDAGAVLPRRKKRGMRNPSPRRELMEVIRAFNHADVEIDRDKFFFSIMQNNMAYARSADLLDSDSCRALLEQYADSNRTLIDTYYRDDGSPLFPDFVPQSAPDFWKPGEPEYFDMLVDVMTAAVRAVSERPAAGAPRKKHLKESGSDEDV
ncbi:MAG TPA: hypothetical protein VMF58_08015 [Rhizomicrobium sp.]|nr:hypothetical protein [Rhizomicrobium sp.]